MAQVALANAALGDSYLLFGYTPQANIYTELTMRVTTAALAAIKSANPIAVNILGVDDASLHPAPFGNQAVGPYDDVGGGGGGSIYNSWIDNYFDVDYIHVAPVPDVVITLKTFVQNSGGSPYFGVDASTATDSNSGTNSKQSLAGIYTGGVNTPGGVVQLLTWKIGTTDGGSDLLDFDFSTAVDLSAFTVIGDVTLGPAPTPVVLSTYRSPQWRFVVLDLATFEVLSILDTIATGRAPTYTLDAPAQAVLSVPSDNPEVNIPWPSIGDDPFLTEGSRTLLGLRRDGTAPTLWTPRFHGIIEQLEDSAQSDNSVTRVTAWDPWQYLMSRPVQNFDGSLPGPNGISFSATDADVIVGELLRNTIVNNGPCGLDMGATYGGTGFYTGTIVACDPIDINFQQGLSVGEAWQQLTNNYDCDILIDPLYDPKNRPGYLGQVTVKPQIGSEQDNAIFAWDLPSKSLVQISRLYDGTLRANKVKFFAGQGGSAVGGQSVPVQTDSASVTKYGEYWRQQFFPGQNVAGAVTLLAQAELAFSKNGRQTVTISPAPERSPQPFLDYFLGDRVPVYASDGKFRALLSGYQRIYGIPITIGDDGTEQVQQLLTTEPTS